RGTHGRVPAPGGRAEGPVPGGVSSLHARSAPTGIRGPVARAWDLRIHHRHAVVLPPGETRFTRPAQTCVGREGWRCRSATSPLAPPALGQGGKVLGVSHALRLQAITAL